jgi:hypothetical protein
MSLPPVADSVRSSGTATASGTSSGNPASGFAPLSSVVTLLVSTGRHPMAYLLGGPRTAPVATESPVRTATCRHARPRRLGTSQRTGWPPRTGGALPPRSGRSDPHHAPLHERTDSGTAPRVFERGTALRAGTRVAGSRILPPLSRYSRSRVQASELSPIKTFKHAVTMLPASGIRHPHAGKPQSDRDSRPRAGDRHLNFLRSPGTTSARGEM